MEPSSDLFIAQQKDIEQDFPGKHSQLLATLKNYQDYESMFPNRYHIGFGPTYATRSSGEIDNFVKVVLLKDGNKVIRYSLIATDKTGQVIGYRSSNLQEIGDGYSTGGFIYTAVRAKGISTVIDSAHTDLLQRLATQYQKPIKWDIMNDNAMKLRFLEEQAEKNPSTDLAVKITAKTIEQRRWQSQYKPGGKFGIDKSESRTFRPQISRLTGKPMIENVEMIENIFLGRNVPDGKFEPVEIERIDEKDIPKFKETNFAFFNKILGTDTIKNL